MKRENPLVSIIIPCYNLSGYLEICLNTCLLQTYKNIEIIIINDCSQDDSQKIIDYYSQIDSRIIPIFNKNNEGVVKSRCKGIEKSSGEYVFFLDGDDYLNLDAIEILVDEIISSNASIVIGQYLHEKETGFHLEEQLEESLMSGEHFIRKILKYRLFTLWAKLYKKELFTDSLNYFSALKRGEDLVLLVQLANNSRMVKGVNKVVYFYRFRGTAVTKSETFKNIHDAYKSRFITEKYVLDYGFSKEKDFELGIFICFILVAMIIDNCKGNFLDLSWKKLIRIKIREYLIESKEFASFYKKNFNKNFLRLKIYYYFFISNEKVFNLVYKYLKKLF